LGDNNNEFFLKICSLGTDAHKKEGLTIKQGTLRRRGKNEILKKTTKTGRLSWFKYQLDNQFSAFGFNFSS
jgi:hypothetical protein